MSAAGQDPLDAAARTEWWRRWTASTRDPALAEGLDRDSTPGTPADHPLAAEGWLQFCRQYRHLVRDAPRQMPHPTANELARLAAILMHPRSRAFVRTLLLELLAPGIAEIALVVRQEGRRG